MSTKQSSLSQLLDTNPLYVFALPEEAAEEFPDVNLLFTGVGKRQATYHLTKRIIQSRPGIIINLGSAGSYTYKRGEIVCCTKFIERDMDVTALGIDKYKTPFSPDEPMLDYGLHVPGFSQSICGSGDCFEITLRSTDYHVIDMEAYPLAWVARQEQVPFLCLKYITDGADDSAAGDWQNSVHKTAIALKQAIKNIRENSM